MNEAAQGNGGSGEDDPSPMNLLSAARRAVPAEDYALGVAGIAAVGAIVIGLLGKGQAIAAAKKIFFC
jgi:hypothetical protein